MSDGSSVVGSQQTSRFVHDHNDGCTKAPFPSFIFLWGCHFAILWVPAALARWFQDIPLQDLELSAANLQHAPRSVKITDFMGKGGRVYLYQVTLASNRRNYSYVLSQCSTPSTRVDLPSSLVPLSLSLSSESSSSTAIPIHFSKD